MNHQALKTLIETHPSWPSVTDAELVIWVNEETVSADKTTIPNSEILAVILDNRAEFTALADGDKQLVRDILYVGDSVPTAPGQATRDTLVAIFGAGSGTISSLAAAIAYQVSRAQAVGILGIVRNPDVAFARTL